MIHTHAYGWSATHVHGAFITHPWTTVSPGPNRGGSVGPCRKPVRGEPALWTNKWFSVSYRDPSGLSLNIQHFYSTGFKTGWQVFCSIAHFSQWTSILWIHLKRSWTCSYFFCFFHTDIVTTLNFSHTRYRFVELSTAFTRVEAFWFPTPLCSFPTY